MAGTLHTQLGIRDGLQQSNIAEMYSLEITVLKSYFSRT